MFDLMRGLTNGLVMRDTQAMLDYVDTQPQAKASSLGGVGYCMSGPFILAACATYPIGSNAVLPSTAPIY
jgi:carboxymethylenebutenolidase